MNDDRDDALPYFIDGFPAALPWPARDLRGSKQRVYWTAALGTATMAGCAQVRRSDVRRFLRNAGFTDVLVTTDAADVAGTVAILREEHRAGRRGGVARDTPCQAVDYRSDASTVTGPDARGRP